MDARRGELFTALFRRVPGGIQRVRDVNVCTAEDLAAEIQKQWPHTCIIKQSIQPFTRAKVFNQASYNNDVESSSVFDASYVKLREITFGYTFPGSLIKNTMFKNVKISVVGRDLWTIYRNTPQGIDPEAGTTSGNGQGIEFGSFLPTRTVGININLVF